MYYRIRYVLDNFATVKEAVEGLPGLPGLSELRTIRDPVCEGATSLPHEEGIVLGGHMAIEDASGDSAVFEHVNGTWQVYHSRTDALVMTNDPPFQDQKKILAEYSPWGGEKKLPEELPGSVSSWDRFVRLEYFITHSPEPKDYAEVIANVRSFISSINVPFGVSMVLSLFLFLFLFLLFLVRLRVHIILTLIASLNRHHTEEVFIPPGGLLTQI